MKIAMAVEGTRGDVYPMLSLGRSLIGAGHCVRLCAPPDFAQASVEAGLDFVPLGVNVRAYLDESAEALHAGGLRFLRETMRFGALSLENQFDVLPGAVQGFDRVFAAGTILGAASAAELGGIPYRYVAYTPAIIPAAGHTPAVLPFQRSSPRLNRLAWWVVRRLFQLAPGRQVDARRRTLGLAPAGDMLRHILGAAPILAADRPLAAMPGGAEIDPQQIRCLHPLEGDPLPAKLEAFLAAGPPPVYLGFGSMPDPHPEKTTARLLDAIAKLGCRALISRGWAGLGDAPLPEGVMVVGAVSHASLFPRLAAVVHHGGAGTTHAAARAGVPQILIPHVLDQYYFAARVAALGVGPPAIPRRALNVERLTETLRATLGNEWLQGRARELADRLADLGSATPDPETLLEAPRPRCPVRGVAIEAPGWGAAGRIE